LIDSRNVGMALGLTVIEAARAAKSNQDLDKISSLVHDLLLKMRIYFIPLDFNYLRRSGRYIHSEEFPVSPTEVRPILNIDNGELSVIKKPGGYGDVLEYLLSILYQDYKSYGIKYIVIHHIHCHFKAWELAEKIKKRYDIEVPIISIGPVIGLHAGPGTVGIVYCLDNPG